MSSNTEQHPIQIERPKEINVAAIESELKNLWREEPAEGESPSSAVIRARVINLMIYVDSEQEARMLDDVLINITDSHPARALVMKVDRAAAQPSLQAWVSARCQLPGPNAKQVCCEQVTFEAEGPLAGELPSAVLPLLAPDLPVFLWWCAVPDLEDPLFKRLVDASDRVVIDSADCPSPRADLVKMAAVLRERPDWTAISDFNWARLTPWRTLFASFYDVLDYRPILERVNELTIQYVPHEGGDISAKAIMLAAWLARSLGWRLDRDLSATDGDDNLFVFKARGGSVKLRFTPAQRPANAGGWIAAAKLTAGGDPTASFSVSRTADGRRLMTEVTLGDVTQATRVLSYRDASESELLAGELSLLGHDQLYQAVIETAAEIAAVDLKQ